VFNVAAASPDFEQLITVNVYADRTQSSPQLAGQGIAARLFHIPTYFGFGARLAFFARQNARQVIVHHADAKNAWLPFATVLTFFHSEHQSRRLVRHSRVR
ncbi:hypothetical protein, partial [Asticcacaulis sp.]|uniref:hypothetical protein n=1 Tax=Asticcacaulis sp. TaxID=1872648 RepID=UPI002629729F